MLGGFGSTDGSKSVSELITELNKVFYFFIKDIPILILDAIILLIHFQVDREYENGKFVASITGETGIIIPVSDEALHSQPQPDYGSQMF